MPSPPYSVEEPRLSPRWVALEGIVGSGKTTTAEIIGAKLGVPTVLEPSAKHPFLDAYYEDPSRFALETELAFMALHLHQFKQSEHQGELITDFAPSKDLLFAELVLSGSDLDLLEAVNTHLWHERPIPSLVLFLDPPVTECIRRIRSRGRAYEQSLGEADLEQLRNKYLAGLGRLGAEVFRVVLDGSESREHVASRALDRVARPGT